MGRGIATLFGLIGAVALYVTLCSAIRGRSLNEGLAPIREGYERNTDKIPVEVMASTGENYGESFSHIDTTYPEVREAVDSCRHFLRMRNEYLVENRATVPASWKVYYATGLNGKTKKTVVTTPAIALTP
ncbi:MAG: hypothetical protein JSW08_02925 [archaeon]|nr:MAG: hypothetical protein JSW08_02925 [archaeon]